jgi:hypothetical protein
VDRRSVLGELDFRPKIETVFHTPGAVIWRVDRKNVTRSRVSKIVGKPLYQRLTIRNGNTARRPVVLMQKGTPDAQVRRGSTARSP